MVEAIYSDRTETWEISYEQTAWQTALIMNSSGNYKKRITPDMLLNKEKSKSEPSKLDKEDKDKRIGDLMKKFNKEGDCLTE